MGTEGATADFRAIFEDVMARQLDGRVRGSPVILLPFGGEVTLQWTSVPVRGREVEVLLPVLLSVIDIFEV